MPERADTIVFVALERRIAAMLYGTTEEEGLVRSSLRSGTIEELKFSAGKIEAYEHVLRLMVEIVKEMNERKT